MKRGPVFSGLLSTGRRAAHVMNVKSVEQRQAEVIRQVQREIIFYTLQSLMLRLGL